jgi:hypothetical protein
VTPIHRKFLGASDLRELFLIIIQPPKVFYPVLDDFVGLAMAWFNGVEPAPSCIPTNLGDAYTLLRQLAQGAFGSSTP